MYKYLVLVAALAGCGPKGDDCQKVYDKLLPMMEKESGKKVSDEDKTKELAKCREHAGSDADSDALMKCVLDASGDDAVKACLAKPMKDYVTKSKKTEAALQLNKLMKNAKVYYITNATYPVGKAAMLPAAPCCKGPNNHCPVDGEAWTKDPTWAMLDFQIDDPNLFQYTYESDGKTVTATAVGDPNCDGKPITYTLSMKSDGGNASGSIAEPPAN